MLIEIDHKLRIAQSELAPDMAHLIEDALTIPNTERQKQMEQGIPGWEDLPESWPLYEYDRQTAHLVLPRGYQTALVNGLETIGREYTLVDNTTFETNPSMSDRLIDLRPWQSIAVACLKLFQDGIWKAPAGSGKTVGILALVALLNCPSIILVNTKDVLYQWIERAHQFLGEDFPVGIIGDGKFEISDYLTIATVQTINSRFDRLERSGFFEEFSLMCLDECHHATAETFNNIVGRFTARYRLGVSATPDKSGEFDLATCVLGPIVHETKRKDVTNLVDPTVYRIPTGFRIKYRGRNGRIPSNYEQVVRKLIADEQRNSLIVCTIMLNKHRHNLVCSRRLEHLAILANILNKCGYPHPIKFLTGKESTEERKAVIDLASLRPCTILSTLADEALDIPRLDGLYLTFPQRNTGLIEQQAGRVGRQHPDKKDASIFDFCDPIKPMEAQWQVRRRDVYQKLGYEIVTVLPSEIADAIEAEFK